MKRTYQATVILPQSYATDGKRYSVIYFLHGYSGDHTTWPRVAPLERYVDSCRVIAVCPDGRYRSWYLDSPVKRASQFDTYVTREIPAFVDSAFRTHASTQGRAIMGSSMGGHGALTLLARHPEVYCGAVSVSGIMDLREFPDEWEIADVLGPCSTNRTRWQEYSFVGLAPKLVGVNKWVALDCGTEDFALDGNRRTHALLTELKIPHEYAEHSGGHTPQYVRGVALTHIVELSKVLLKPE